MAGAELRFRVRLKRFWRTAAVLIVGGLSWWLCAAVTTDLGYVRADQEAARRAERNTQKIDDAREELNRGNFAEAFDALAPFVRTRGGGENESRALLLQGKAAWALGGDEEARALFGRVLEEHPRSFEAPKAAHKLAWMSLIAGDREEAHRGFGIVSRKGSTLWPEAAALAAWTGGEAYDGGMRSGTPIRGHRFWEAKQGLLDRSSDSARAFGEVQASHRGSERGARAGFFLGKARLGQGRVQAAAGVWRDVAAQRPNGPWGSRSQFKLAVVLLLQGEVPKAKARLSAVRGGPLKAEAVVLRRWLDTDPELPAPLR